MKKDNLFYGKSFNCARELLMTEFRSITLVFNRKPLPKQSARFAAVSHQRSIISYQTPKIKQYESNLLIEALSQVRGGFKPLQGCLSIEIEFCYKYPVSMKAALKNHIKAGGKIFKTTRPDVTDNLNKPVMDALQGRFYKEDCIIAKSKSSKVYGLRNRITLKISEIDIFIY